MGCVAPGWGGAYWLCDGQTGLTFNNFTLYPHCTYAFFLFISQQTATSDPYNKLIGFYNRDGFYCAVRTGALNKAVCASSFKGSGMLCCLTRHCTITRF